MNPSGLLRTLFASVFALVLMGGLMVAQAQTVTVDQDGGQDATTISDGLDQLDGMITGSEEGTLRVFAGDYIGTDADVDVGGGRTMGTVNIVVVRDDDDDADALEIESLDLNGVDVNVASETGDGFLFVHSSGGVTVGAAMGGDSFDLVIRSLLTVEDPGALVFQDPDNGGGTVKIFADDGVEGENIVFNGTDTGDIARVEYEISGGLVNAGSELGTSFGTDLVDELAVDGTNNSVEELLQIFTDLTVGDFTDYATAGAGTITDVDVRVEGDFSVGSDVTVPDEGDLTVTGLFQITSASPPSLTVNGSVNPGSDVGNFEFTNDNGTITVANTSGSTVGDAAENGDVAFNDVTVPVDGTTPTIITDGGTPGTVDISGATLSVTGGSANVVASQASDFDILNITGGPVNVNDSGTTNDANITVGGALSTVTVFSSGTTIELAGGTVVGGLNNNNQGGTIRVSDDVIYDRPAAGSAVQNGVAGAQIVIESGNVLAVTDTSDGDGHSVTALVNNGASNGGVSGGGTLELLGADDDAGSVDELSITIGAGGGPNVLPTVVADAEVIIQDESGTPGDININGDLTARSISSNSGTPTVRFLGASPIGDITIAGDVTADGTVHFGASGNGSGDLSNVTIGGTLTANAGVLLNPAGGMDGQFTAGSIVANGPGTVDLSNADAADNNDPDVFVENNITVVASAAGTTFDFSGIVVELRGDFDRLQGPATFSGAVITTTSDSELRFTGSSESVFSSGSKFTLSALLRIDQNESPVIITEAVELDNALVVEEPGSPNAPNNHLIIQDNVFLTGNGTRVVADGDIVTGSMLIFDGGGAGDTFTLERNDRTGVVGDFIPTVGDMRIDNTATLTVTSSTGLDFDLGFAGLVEIRNGTLDVANGGTGGNFFATRNPDGDGFSSPNPRILRRLDNTTSFGTSGAASTFNADPSGPQSASDYHLTVSGNNDSTLDSATETQEFQPVTGNVDNLTVRDDAQYRLTGDREAVGNLTVGLNGIIRTSGADRTLALTGSGASHSVRGAISGFDTAGEMTLRLQGDEATVAGDNSISVFSIIQNLWADASDLTVENVHQIAKDVDVSAGSSLDLGLADPDPTSNLGDQRVYGNLAIAGNGSLTLLSPIEVATGSADNDVLSLGNDHDAETSNVTVGNGGSIAFSTFNLRVDDGNFTGQANASYTTSGGTLVMSSTSGSPSTFGTNGEDIRRVEFEETTGLSSNSTANVAVTFNNAVQSQSNNLSFSGEADLNVTPAFIGTGFLVSTGTTVELREIGSDENLCDGTQVLDNDTAKNHTTPDFCESFPELSGEEPSGGDDSKTSEPAPKSHATVATNTIVSRFRVDSGNSTTTIQNQSSGNATLEVSQILDLTSGTLNHGLDIALTGNSATLDELQASGGTIERTSGRFIFDADGNVTNHNATSSNFTLGLSSPLAIPRLEVSDVTKMALASSAVTPSDENLKIGTSPGILYLRDKFLSANSSGGLEISDLSEIIRTGPVGTDDILDENPTFLGMYDLTYGDGSSNNSFQSGRELSDAAASDPDIRNLEVNTGTGGTVEFDNDERGGPVVVNNLLNLRSGESEGERQVIMIDGSQVDRHGDHSHESTTATPSRLPIFETTGNYTVRYHGDTNITANPVELIEGSAVVHVLSEMTASSLLEIAIAREIISLTINNSPAAVTRIAALITVANATGVNSGELQIDSGHTLEANGTVTASGADAFVHILTNAVLRAALLTAITDGAELRTEGQAGGLSGNEGVLDADDDLEVSGDGSRLAAVFQLFGNLILANDVHTYYSGSGTVLRSFGTFDGEDDQNVDMTDFSRDQVGLAKMTLAQSVNNMEFPKVTVEGANLALTGVPEKDPMNGPPVSEDVLVFDNGLLDVSEGDIPSANHVAIANFEDTFSRTDVDIASSANNGEGDVGHVVGAYRQQVAGGQTGVYTAPVGADVASRPSYRLYRIFFRNSTPIQNTMLDVEHVNRNPKGVQGLPLQDDTGLTIGSYPHYFWRISTTKSLGPGQEVEQEVLADNLQELYDNEENLRLIQRGDGDVTQNEWDLVGDGTNYDNIGDAQTEPDDAVRIRTTKSIGDFEEVGVRLTAGAPSRPPLFTALDFDPASQEIAETETQTARFRATSQDIGQALTTLDTSDVPADARQFVSVSKIDTDSTATDSIEVEFTPDKSFVAPSDGGSRTVTLAVKAVDPDGSRTQTFDVTVNDNVDDPAITAAPSQPVAASDTGRTADNPDSFQITAEVNDPNGGPISFSVNQPWASVASTTSTSATTSNASNHVFTATINLTPGFPEAQNVAQSGNPLSLTVDATDDGVGRTVSTSVDVDVKFDRYLGDVDGSGLPPRANDAVLALNIAVGKTSFDQDNDGNDEAVLDGQIRVADFSTPAPGDTLDAEQSDVNSFDAFQIFQATIPSGSGAALAGAKSSATDEGALHLGEVKTEGSTVTMPLVLSDNASGIHAADVTLDLGSEVASVKNVQSQAPESWMLAHNRLDDGTVKLGMAGRDALQPGTVATIQVELKGNGASVEPTGTYRVNAGELQDLDVQNRPAEFALMGNYPNPAQASTTIEYQLKEASSVKLEVYNMLGQRVATLVDQNQDAGTYDVTWNVNEGVSSGVYFYRLEAGDYTASEKVTVVR